MRLVPVFALLIVLAGCATPREACVRSATRDLRVIDQLVSETEGNIRRGYALREQPAVREGLEVCGRLDGSLTFCNTTELTTRIVPQAIDLQDERRKLASLRDDRAQRAGMAGPRIAACQRQYPPA